MTSIATRQNLSHPRCQTLGGRLDAEWARLRKQPAAIRRANGWPIVETPIADLDQVLRLIGFEQQPCPASDDRLLQLILLARTDEVAARVIVQRVLPGLLAVVRRRRRIHGENTFEELLGALWVAIRTFTPTRRPSSPAAALIADADYRAFGQAARRRGVTMLLIDTSAVEPVATTTTSPDDELDDLFRAARDAGFTENDVQFLRNLLSGSSAIDIAATMNVTPRTLRNRRDRLTVRLRELALAA